MHRHDSSASDPVHHSSPDPSSQDVPLLVTADEDLRATVTSAANAAGLRVQAIGDRATALQRWAQPPALLLGADVAPELRTHREAVPRDHVLEVLQPSPPSREPDAHVKITDTLVPTPPTPAPWPIVNPAEAMRYLRHRFIPGRGQGIVIGVIGGVGGAGATVTAAAIAAAGARRGGRAVLIDLDPLGGGVDRLLGLQTLPGARWPTLRITEPPMAGWLDRLPARAGVTVLAWDPAEQAALPQGVLRRVFAAARRDAHLVVVDLPRHLTTASRKALQRTDYVLMVTTNRRQSLSASTAVLNRLARRHVHTATRMTGADAFMTAPFVSAELDTGYAGTIPDDPAAGAGPKPIDLHTLVHGAIGTFAGDLLDAIGPTT